MRGLLVAVLVLAAGCGETAGGATEAPGIEPCDPARDECCEDADCPVWFCDVDYTCSVQCRSDADCAVDSEHPVCVTGGYCSRLACQSDDDCTSAERCSAEAGGFCVR